MLGSNVRFEEFTAAVLGLSRPFSGEEQAVLLAGYAALAEGSPVLPERIAGDAGVAMDVVRETFRAWPGIAHLDPRGRVTALLGLSLEPTGHRFEVDQRTLFTWCAWDTLFIPRVLGRTARVESRCPSTGALIRLVVTPSGIAGVTPADTMMSLLIACDAAGGSAAVGACCPHIHFLASTRAADEWLRGEPAGHVVTLDEAWHLACEFVDSRLRGGSAPRSDTSERFDGAK